ALRVAFAWGEGWGGGVCNHFDRFAALGSGQTSTVRMHAYGQHEKEVRRMTPMQRLVLVAGAAGSLIAGGVIGASLAGPLAASASNGSNGGQSASASNGGALGFLAAATASPAAGTFKSNEDATHEAGESAAREAAENNGTAHFGGGAGGSNENATHEAGESAAREAQENSAKAAAPTTPAPTTPSPSAQ
ncbi:MAG: hypothetical protein ABI401_16635, partial [Candidatus Dormibacter sp.]